jgi:hypothetical protein
VVTGFRARRPREKRLVQEPLATRFVDWFARLRAREEDMPSNLQPENRTAWLLLIGRRLRAEYDAVAEPVPPRLAALIQQLETSAQNGGSPDGGSQEGSPQEGESAGPFDDLPLRMARA